MTAAARYFNKRPIAVFFVLSEIFIMKENDVNILKRRCDESLKKLKKISIELIGECEQIISVCNDRKNMFGSSKDEKARAETLDLCVKKLKAINALSQSALDSVLTIYTSVMKFNELGSTPHSTKTTGYSSEDIISYSYFFTLANKIGNVFEDLFESDLPKLLNGIVEGLDLDNNGTRINMNSVIANTKSITNSVSKATNYYLKEV